MNEQSATASLEVPQGNDVAITAQPTRAESRFHPRHWSFRLKLGLLALALGIVPATLVVLLLSWRAATLTQDTLSAATAARMRSGAALVEQVLAVDVRVLTGIAATEPVHLLASDPNKDLAVLQYRLTPVIATATGSLPGLETLYVANSGGAVLAANRPAVLDAKAGGVLAVQEALTSAAPAAVIGTTLGTGQPALIMAVPIRGQSGVVGAVVGEFNPSALFSALDAGGGIVLLADGRTISGHVLPSGAPAQLLGTRLAPALPALLTVPLAAHAGEPQRLNNGLWVAAIAPDGLSSSLALEMPQVGTEQASLGSATLPALLALALLTVLAAILGTLSLTRPLARLAQKLGAVRLGNYGIRVAMRQQDEIGQIAATVDMLTARTQLLVSDLDDQRLELENGIIQLFTELAEAASGDLTVRPTMSEGSLGAVADSVGILLERFNATVKRIQVTASLVSTGTSQVAATVLRVSQESQKQATQLTSGVAAIAEMAASAQSVSQRTQAATDVASQAVVAVENGNKAVNYAREAVKRTSETSKRAARQVKSLGESAQLMGNALLLVQRNTEELHLIAGNASIEAARYAENGGVFRTVADSIEQLAQQSQVALRQIQSVVEATLRETSRVVAAIDEVTAEVVNVARAVGLAGENFDTINMVVQRLADLNVFIASASEQQAQMAADVAEVIGTLNQVSVQTSMNTAASAEAAVRLRQLTEQLNDSVSTLKVS